MMVNSKLVAFLEPRVALYLLRKPQRCKFGCSPWRTDQ